MTREPIVAGMFYEDDFNELDKQINDCFTHKFGPGDLPIKKREKKILGVVVPHAGYVYSGPCAAWSFKEIAESKFPDLFIIIGLSHSGFGSCVSLEDWETPFGVVKNDKEFTKALIENSKLKVNEEAHAQEHSLEVQLPFLQVVLDEFKVVPVVMGSQSRTSCASLGEALGAVLEGKPALIVASSDLSHFHNQSLARELDEQVIASIDCFDPDRLLRDITERKTEACGAGPIAAAMAAARLLGAKTGENLFYSTSGDTSGDYSQVVGYTAGIFYR